jgi:tape measure domain-containing protein
LNVFSLFASLILDKSKYSSGLSAAEQEAQSADTKIGSAFAGLATRVGGVLATIGTAAIGAVTSLGGVGIKLAADFEQTEIAFTTLLGSAETAKTVLADLNTFAASTPFQFPELANATRNLAAFGVDAEDLVPTLQRIGDVSAGISAPIGEIAEIYGKARVQGRLFAEDINQLTGRGIPIIGELAAQFGVTESAVRELVENGEVSFDNLEQAFVSLTSEGGKFEGMMVAQSQTLKGIWSTFTDNLTMMLRGVGERLIETFDLKDKLQLAVDAMTQYAPIIEGVITQTFNVIGAVVNQITEAVTTFLTFFKGQLENNEGEISAWSTKASEYLTGFLGGASAIFTGLVNLWTNVLKPAWDEISPFVLSAFTAAVDVLSSSKDSITSIFNFLVTLWTEVLRPAWEAIQPLVEGIWGAVVAAVTTAFELIAPIFDALTALLKGDFSAAWESAKEAARIALEGLGEIVTSLGEGLVNSLYGIGSNLVQGLIDGISSMWDSAKTKVQDLGNSVVTWFKDVLGIQSPSTVFAEIGAWVLEGFINGFTNMVMSVKDTVQGAANSVIGWFKDTLGIESPSKVFAELGENTIEGFLLGLAKGKSKLPPALQALVDIALINNANDTAAANREGFDSLPDTSQSGTPELDSIKQSFLELGNKVIPGLSSVLTAFQAGPVAGIVAIFTELLGRSSAFSALLERVNGFINYFADILGSLIEALWPLIEVVLQVVNVGLQPVLFLLKNFIAPVLKAVSFVIASIWNLLSTVIEIITFGLVKLGKIDPNGTIPEKEKDVDNTVADAPEPKKPEGGQFGDSSTNVPAVKGSIAEMVVGVGPEVMRALLAPLLQAELLQVSLLQNISTSLSNGFELNLQAAQLQMQSSLGFDNAVTRLNQQLQRLEQSPKGSFNALRAAGI